VLRAVIFDLGNTIAGLDPAMPSARTDYADVVARPGAERVARYLRDREILAPKAAGERFIERLLDIRERNRLTADRTGREITAFTSLEEALALGVPPDGRHASDQEAFASSSFEEERIVSPGTERRFLKKRGVPWRLQTRPTDRSSTVWRRVGVRGI
jgi:hypothetical protein